MLFKLALAFHMSLRFAEANEMYQRAFDLWRWPEGPTDQPSSTLRVGTSFLPNDPDPRSAIAWPNIQLCMQLFDRLVEAWPERTIVPSLAERWEISDDGLRYVFHLREGLTWSDGEPLTAHDVEFGIKRVLNPDAPGSSVAIYFVLEHGQDHYLRTTEDPDLIGVRALDDRTVEFRLAAPAPYFMSVMNRPDGGPQPRHAIERDGDAWTETGKQVVSGAFEIAERHPDRLVLRRREDPSTPRPGNVATVEYVQREIPDAIAAYARDELDAVTVRYTPKTADLVPGVSDDAHLGAASWSGFLAFRHADPRMANVEVRRALASAIDRETLAEHVPSNLVVANGGIVPPALQGHTPDIVPRFDPDAAREHLRRSGLSRDELEGLEIAGIETWLDDFLLVVSRTWKEVLDLDVPVRPWTLEQALSIGDPTEMAPIVITGMAARLRRSRVLPSAAVPERQQDELRHVLRPRVRPAHRAGSSGAERPVQVGAVPRGRSDGRGRSDRLHPARLRAEHVVREAVGQRLVGVREVLVVRGGPDDGRRHVDGARGTGLLAGARELAGGPGGLPGGPRGLTGSFPLSPGGLALGPPLLLGLVAQLLALEVGGEVLQGVHETVVVVAHAVPEHVRDRVLEPGQLSGNRLLVGGVLGGQSRCLGALRDSLLGGLDGGRLIVGVFRRVVAGLFGLRLVDALLGVVGVLAFLRVFGLGVFGVLGVLSVGVLAFGRILAFLGLTVVGAFGVLGVLDGVPVLDRVVPDGFTGGGGRLVGRVVEGVTREREPGGEHRHDHADDGHESEALDLLHGTSIGETGLGTVGNPTFRAWRTLEPQVGSGSQALQGAR